MRPDWRTRIALLADLVVNLLLPWLVYDQTVASSGERGALLWSALPPTLWSLWELYRHRRLDAMSALVLTGIALSLLAMLGDGDSRWLLVRESLVTGAVGLVFLLSLLWRQPLLGRLALAAAARQFSSRSSMAEIISVFTARMRRNVSMESKSGGLSS